MNGNPTQDLAFSTEEVNPLVNAICQDALRTGANLTIHQRDEMFELFFYRNQRDRDRSVTMYIDSGMSIWSAVRQVLEWHCGTLERAGEWLDFAGGFGRVTRFIAAELGPERVWSAEINETAVEFQRRQFGVHALLSSAEPEAFRCDRRFDAILVSSLFTHLPRERFVGWMRRLAGLLAPGGILLFSVHDESLLGTAGAGAGAATPLHDGLLFKPESESAFLPGHEYGSTWVSETFVRTVLDAAIPGAEVRRLARGFANFQDLYVVTREPAKARGELRLRRRIDGFVEHCSLASTRSLQIVGWVIDRVSGVPPREVQVLVDGALVGRCGELIERLEVMAAFPGASAEGAMARGWRLIAPLPARGSLCPCRLEIRTIGGTGEEMLLYADSVESALLRSLRLDFLATRAQMVRERAEAADRLAKAATQSRHLIAVRDIRIEALEATIKAMEGSRFWKIRHQWFRLKRALRLTTQP